MPINKNKLDKDLSKYIGCYVEYSVRHSQFTIIEKIVSNTKSELKTQKGTRIRVSWYGVDSCSLSVFGSNQTTVYNIYTFQELLEKHEEEKNAITEKYKENLDALWESLNSLKLKTKEAREIIDSKKMTPVLQKISELKLKDFVVLTEQINVFRAKLKILCEQLNG